MTKAKALSPEEVMQANAERYLFIKDTLSGFPCELDGKSAIMLNLPYALANLWPMRDHGSLDIAIDITRQRFEEGLQKKQAPRITASKRSTKDHK